MLVRPRRLQCSGADTGSSPGACERNLTNLVSRLSRAISGRGTRWSPVGRLAGGLLMGGLAPPGAGFRGTGLGVPSSLSPREAGPPEISPAVLDTVAGVLTACATAAGPVEANRSFERGSDGDDFREGGARREISRPPRAALAFHSAAGSARAAFPIQGRGGDWPAAPHFGPQARASLARGLGISRPHCRSSRSRKETFR